jgi:hypothetical protein
MESRPMKHGLEYDGTSHLHCGITLRSGRLVTVESLTQSQTYAGWLEGIPRAEINERIIEAAVPPRAVLIRPVRRNYLRQPGDTPDPANATEWLPLVTCTARLTSDKAARSESPQGSFLTVVWYQDEFALPIDPSVLAQISDLPWESLASDQEED